LPFPTDDATVRWVQDGVARIQPAVGTLISAVLIGRGQMSIEGRELEIWTRLLIECDGCWLEIFNALDENGYDFHTTMPTGTFLKCI
jgi:hypothetical protein